MIRLFGGLATRAMALALAAAASCDVSSTAPAPGAGPAAFERVAEEPSEERIQEIWNSPEVARLMDLHAEFVARMDTALQRGATMQELRAASHQTLAGDDSHLATLLFGGRRGADQYVASLRAARAAISNTYPEINSAQRRVDPGACNVEGNSVDAFFDNFDAIRAAQVSGRNLPTSCDYTAFLFCHTGCVVAGAPQGSELGIAWCAFKCLCKYCPSGLPCGPATSLDP